MKRAVRAVAEDTEIAVFHQDVNVLPPGVQHLDRAEIQLFQIAFVFFAHSCGLFQNTGNRAGLVAFQHPAVFRVGDENVRVVQDEQAPGPVEGERLSLIGKGV